MNVRRSKERANLNTCLKNKSTCYLDIFIVIPSEDYMNNAIGYILSGITGGLFIVVLQDISVGHSYITGINRGLKVFYDCMKTHKLQLNHNNLCKRCGPTYVFLRLYIAAELVNIRAHAQTHKDEFTIDNLFKKILQVISAHTYRKLPRWI